MPEYEKIMTGHTVLRIPPRILLPALIILVLAGVFFRGTATDLFIAWEQPEYSYGYFVPLVALYWAWKIYQEQKPLLRPEPAGLGVIAFALFMNLFGDIAANNWINHASLALAPMGFIIAFMGFAAFWGLLPALALPFFAIPLPPSLMASLTSDMQLASTTLSVLGLRLLSIPVYQEGNIIDLGTYKLQVVEACSGLRYLFPFLCFGYLFAFWFEKNAWKRAILIASAVPITLAMNALRILLVGVTVDAWGMKAADGLLHDFEGWIVFVGCILCLFLVSCGLSFIPFAKIGRAAKPQAEATQPSSKPFGGAIAIMFLGLAAQVLLAARPIDQIPPRQPLADFPLQLGIWHGATGTLSPDELASLRLSDYVMVDYHSDDSPTPINFYAAYYASQRRDAAPHSPLVCMPGSGWDIATLDRHFPLRDASGNIVLYVDRAIVKNGETTDLVYFWFRERGRNLTTAPQRKWYLFRDSLTEGRTDGALIRIVTPVANLAAIGRADQALTDFSLQIFSKIRDFVPD